MILIWQTVWETDCFEHLCPEQHKLSTTGMTIHFRTGNLTNSSENIFEVLNLAKIGVCSPSCHPGHIAP